MSELDALCSRLQLPLGGGRHRCPAAGCAEVQTSAWPVCWPPRGQRPCFLLPCPRPGVQNQGAWDLGSCRAGEGVGGDWVPGSRGVAATCPVLLVPCAIVCQGRWRVSQAVFTVVRTVCVCLRMAGRAGSALVQISKARYSPCSSSKACMTTGSGKETQCLRAF